MNKLGVNRHNMESVTSLTLSKVAADDRNKFSHRLTHRPSGGELLGVVESQVESAEV